MKGREYENRPPYPATWARMNGRGRVFYTSLGHNKAVWEDPIMQKVVMSGLAWVLGETQAEVGPNLKEVCPQPAELMAPEK
jgi:type 1 glutamine amidotransferase